MIPDLRARLRQAAAQAAPQARREECLIVQKHVPLPAEEAQGLCARTAQKLRGLGLEMERMAPERMLFVDTETTGLAGAGTVAFLVGMAWLEGDGLCVTQLFLRDYAQEAAQLEAFAARLDWAQCLVSFNGKSFDLPVLRDRFTMLRMREKWREKPHLDLLHAARRTWKARLGDCSLGALERKILCCAREDDLPGAQVPERFFGYLRTGDFSFAEPILRHNEQDVVSLVRLLWRLICVYETAEEQQNMLDVLAVGQALERFGETERARRCYHVASVSVLGAQARRRLALSFAHTREYADAAKTYRTMIARGEGDAQTYRALAVLLEWHLNRPQEALQVTQSALMRFSGGDFRYRVDEEVLRGFQRRYERLCRKLAARE